MSGFRDSCKQLNGISANPSMNRAPVSWKRRRWVAATGAVTWQSGGPPEHLLSFQAPSTSQLARRHNTTSAASIMDGRRVIFLLLSHHVHTHTRICKGDSQVLTTDPLYNISSSVNLFFCTAVSATCFQPSEDASFALSELISFFFFVCLCASDSPGNRFVDKHMLRRKESVIVPRSILWDS